MPAADRDDHSRRMVSADRIKEVATILGSAAILFTALLWYLGRRFASGYFDSMNIPLYQLNFSLWEYGEVSVTQLTTAFALVVLFLGLVVMKRRGLPFLQYIFGKVPLVLQTLFLLVCSAACLLFVYKKFRGAEFGTITEYIFLVVLILIVFSAYRSVSPFRATKAKNDHSESLNDYISLVLSVYLAIMLFFLIGQSAFETGRKAGKKATTDRSLGVKLALTGPIFAHLKFQKNEEEIGKDGLYVYEGLRLLTYNDKRFFLFDKLDVNCKPSSVIIVREEEVRAVIYEPASPLKCN